MKKAPRGLRGGIGLAVAAFLLVTAGVALAVIGLQNPGFENGLDNWQVHTERGSGTTRQIVYGPGGTKGEAVPCDDKPYGICVVGTDTFDYFTGHGGEIATATVSPVQGSKMLRLGGPFGGSNVLQNRDRLVVQQDFVVDPANPVLQLNYDVFTFDYSGYDQLEFRATLTDEDGQLIDSRTQGSFASGVSLKSSGWRPNQVNLAAYAGQPVHLRISSGGTQDELYGFWAYIDAGMVPAPAVSGAGATASAPALPGGGSVHLNKYTDPNTGMSYFTIPSSQAASFPLGCMPLDYALPINPGGGTVSNVKLRLGATAVPMTNSAGNTWAGQIPCVSSGTLSVQYDLTENGVTQHFVVSLGGIVLVDPQGVVYDKARFDAAKLAGKSDAEARAIAAIPGATVTLQRGTGGSFVNVLSGDPGISPNVNPETTGSDGLYQWDVAAGSYRVVVTKAGYDPAISRVVAVPPEVTDLHIAMTKTAQPKPPSKVVDEVPPNTSIVKGPGKVIKTKKKKAKAKFSFTASEPGSTFQCLLDKGKWKGCSSSTTVTTGKGSHVLQVRATDPAGNTDSSPAKAKWKVKLVKSGK